MSRRKRGALDRRPPDHRPQHVIDAIERAYADSRKRVPMHLLMYKARLLTVSWMLAWLFPNRNRDVRGAVIIRSEDELRQAMGRFLHDGPGWREKDIERRSRS